MTKIFGLAGLRPGDGQADKVTCPPYDVIKPDTRLEGLLRDNPKSLYHVILGDAPASALERLIEAGVLIKDDEPAYYVYEQRYGGQRRLGFFAAPEVTPYEAREVIRHEKTFDEKVKGRIKLMEDTGYVTEPIWLLTTAPVTSLLEEICAGEEPLYEFVSDFQGESELSGIQKRIYKISEDSSRGEKLTGLIGSDPLYIADGHHRYHSALRMGLDRCIAYICPAGQAKIQAYNRVIRGQAAFEAVLEKLCAEAVPVFETPERHAFVVYTAKGCWQFRVADVDDEDVIKRLDCHILERSLYPLLGLNHDMVMDSRYFDYYPEQDLTRMKEVVDEGVYDMAVALHPVSPEELMAVADAGIVDPDIVMPEKSTFFAPKILSGLILIPTVRR
ncbi:MAG: DUF1015 domain-containing protein [Peptococcaceae bacterium]|jgi:uncharacterized protein (DUF1015 family)|nr:DUF1015 domain-containing protein [Peptococcaceae bacterium]